ncbi:VOC family protein [Aeromicrobium sp. IC_218]|uniref:VOC family protein n=1 Tax=Aeromicrobium sp. IC_218 TaxID=2545468 RepID=UPI001040D07A|nr:VOC family protein [Aeromicrobium sp. IC_218]TCI99675.1 VOC family protein [Aeromicrobium sp. IC_218]
MSGRVVHFEIPFDDGDRARAFYAEIFGWHTEHMPGMGYTLLQTGPTDGASGPTEPGFINGGMFERTADFPGTGPNVVVDVPDIDATLQRIEAAGGKAVGARTPVGDMGFAAYFTDPEGNLIGLWENASS